MRVALLSHNAQTGDAIGNQIAEKLAFFLERGADVRVFLESEHDLHPFVRPHAEVYPAPDAGGDAWQFLAGADLVIAEYGQYYPLLNILPLLADGRPRILLDYHGVTPPDLWGLQNHEALTQGVRQRGLVWCADAVLVHSRYILHELRTHCALPSERLHQLGFPVDASEFRPGDGGRWRQTLGLHAARILLFVGRLAPNKRVPLLIEALARLRDLSPPVHGLVVGTTGDVYRVEAQRCRQRAAELGVADRLHFLGRQTGQALGDAYRAADVFVIPSLWESFCIPAIEAMACGVPVVAARTTALPETVADAGLTCRPDDADDLARQLRRILEDDNSVVARSPDRATGSDRRSPRSLGDLRSGRWHGQETLPQRGFPCHSPRVAVVSFRYGTDFAGGAETSLRTIAETLHAAGCAVEVFTTCTRSESVWSDELPGGTTHVNGVPVHRFRLDPHDRPRHLETVRTVWEANGRVGATAEQDYLRHSIHSTRLIDALRQRADDFDAVITGPYLFGLTHDVAAALPDKTLLLPCFHDEPIARLESWQKAYEQCASLLYHSPEEQRFAEVDLGLNHPGAACIGTYLDTENLGDPEAGRRAVGATAPYVVYAGRYSLQKELPTLFEHARRYEAEHPGRFVFVFLGQGQVAIPSEPWARDLGFVDERRKRDVLAGAAALVQPSPYESLSLASLEAWIQGTPVLANARSAVLAGHLQRSGAGRAVDGYEQFAAALDNMWDNPELWRQLGQEGQVYVRGHYGSRDAFARRLLEALHAIHLPLAERMRRRGLQRAATFSRPAWREQFSAVVERLLHAPPRPYRERVEVRPRGAERTVAAGAEAILVPVRVVNRGTHPLVVEGPARTVLRCRVLNEQGRLVADGTDATPLPGLLQPGRALTAAVPVPVPSQPGTYEVIFWAERVEISPLAPGRRGEGQKVPSTEYGVPSPEEDSDSPQSGLGTPYSVLGTLSHSCTRPGVRERRLRLVVVGQGEQADGGCCAAALEAARAALVEANGLQRLPDDYTDVTEGLFASWKRRLKRKLLGNFKHAYVDVLSRQQSAFNRQVLGVVRELAECCATLDHAVHILLQRVAELEGRGSEKPAGVSRPSAEDRETAASKEEAHS
jgi:glycosyltransferase involved in cell wall biosynthesis